MKNISKIVISKDDAKRLGYVLDVVWDESLLSVLGYAIVDEESENEFFVSIKDIKFVGEIGFVDEASVLQFMAHRKASLVGKTILSQNGVDLGRIEKVEVARNKCLKISTDKCEIKANQIKFVGEDYVFLGKKRSLTKPQNFPKAESDVDVTIMSTQKVKVPEKVSLSTNYYLGKICGKDIFGYNNERIAIRGEKISKATIEKVKKHNKLNELFFALST